MTFIVHVTESIITIFNLNVILLPFIFWQITSSYILNWFAFYLGKEQKYNNYDKANLPEGMEKNDTLQQIANSYMLTLS